MSADRVQATAFPLELDLRPLSRRPTVLPAATVDSVLRADAARLGPRAPNENPVASIVVVAFNGLVFTRLCLESVLANTDGPPYELVLVDNASSDGTRDYLAELGERWGFVRVLVNDGNRGFAPAVNQGLAASRGEFLVVLNNDTIVPPGWLPPFLGHLADERVGLVGPVTNRSGTESEIDASYRTYGELVAFSARRAEQHAGTARPIRMPAMFCVGLRRDVYERIGPLDERYEVGNFEDEDYALRCHSAGYRLLRAEDVFVHHFGEAAFGELFASGERGGLFVRNRERFEEKWGRPWRSARRPASPQYARLRRRVRDAVRESVPEGATVAVVSRGDDDLLRVGRAAVHFPQLEDGTWSGGHPGTSADAIEELERARARGAAFLVMPATAFWWLDYYEGFRRHLEQHYPAPFERRGTCMVFPLDARGSA